MSSLELIGQHCKGSVYLTINPHRVNYESIFDYLEDEEVDLEILDIMTKEDVLYELQFYPETPIGFYVVHHWDLESCIEIAVGILEEENERRRNI